MARIVLVTDDDALRRDLRKLVGTRGHSVLDQPGRNACRGNCLEAPVDAAFVDLSTDGDDRVAAVAATRSRMPGTRIAVIDGGRGCSSLDRLARAVSLGADDFMKKPILVSDATDVLERLGL
jgi:ActR/RegA family two-component response regulator